MSTNELIHALERALLARLREQPAYWVEVSTTPMRRTAKAVLIVDVARAIAFATRDVSDRLPAVSAGSLSEAKPVDGGVENTEQPRLPEQP
jgi:hypothetical protein